MNLVPFPRMHYLISALTPLYSLMDVNTPPRRYFFFYDGCIFFPVFLMLEEKCTSGDTLKRSPS